MSEFHFDPSLSSDDNLDAFWAHLRTINPEYAKQLENNLPLMLPLSATGADRTEARERFNGAISKVLDTISVDSHP